MGSQEIYSLDAVQRVHVEALKGSTDTICKILGAFMQTKILNKYVFYLCNTKESDYEHSNFAFKEGSRHIMVGYVDGRVYENIEITNLRDCERNDHVIKVLLKSVSEVMGHSGWSAKVSSNADFKLGDCYPENIVTVRPHT